MYVRLSKFPVKLYMNVCFVFSVTLYDFMTLNMIPTALWHILKSVVCVCVTSLDVHVRYFRLRPFSISIFEDTHTQTNKQSMKQTNKQASKQADKQATTEPLKMFDQLEDQFSVSNVHSTDDILLVLVIIPQCQHFLHAFETQARRYGLFTT